MPRRRFCAVAFLMDFWWDTVFCLHSRVSYPCLAIFPIEVSQQCEKHGRKYRENRRGVERESLHYGYANIPIEDPSRPGKYGRPAVSGVELHIIEEQAAVVRRIFNMYASGLGLALIA